MVRPRRPMATPRFAMATIADFLAEWRSDSPYIVAHTSGSTGTPKAIHLLKSDMMLSAANTVDFFSLGSNSVLALPLSADYIAGKMMAVRALVCGGKLLELPVSNRIELPGPVDFLAVVPSQLESVLQQPREAVGALLVGGAPMTAEQERALAASGIPAWIGYGMTETCSHIALRRIGSDKVFHAVGDVTFSVDENSCLIIRSDKFSWRTLATRDVVRLISDTAFEWVGRADNVINSGGIKIHPEQLEADIRALLPHLPDFYITSVQHPRWGQAPAMVIGPGAVDANLWDVLHAGLKDSRHTPYKIYVTDSLPRTSNNKVKRIIPDQKYEI